jgi:hypothetical protein
LKNLDLCYTKSAGIPVLPAMPDRQKWAAVFSGPAAGLRLPVKKPASSMIGSLVGKKKHPMNPLLK